MINIVVMVLIYIAMSYKLYQVTCFLSGKYITAAVGTLWILIISGLVLLRLEKGKTILELSIILTLMALIKASEVYFHNRKK